MKPLKHIFLLTLISLGSLPAFAGPSDGGGTNLQDNQLVDFVKAQQEKGAENYVIRPRIFKQKGDTSVYEKIKPLIDRAEQLYPGMGKSMEGAFDKQWIVLDLGDKEFAPRKPGERKPISQTKDTVYINLKWLREKTTTPELLKQAFLHEGARNFATEYVPFVFGSKDVIAAHLEDEVTETLTPALYNKQPLPILDERLQKLRGSFQEHGNRTGRFVTHRMITRAELYADLKATDAASAIRKICEKANGSFWESRNVDQELKAWEKRANEKAFANLAQKLRYTRDTSTIARPKGFDDGAEATLSFLRDLVDSNRDAAQTAATCRAKKYERFLSEYEKDQGQALAEEVDEIPDAATESTNTDAK